MPADNAGPPSRSGRGNGSRSDPFRDPPVARFLEELAEKTSRRLGVSRRRFLESASGMAAAFMALNLVHGPLFRIDPAEAADPAAAAARLDPLRHQFIFDAQTHFVGDRYRQKRLLALRREAKKWNPQLKDETATLAALRYEPYLQELFLKSDTTGALLSTAPADDPGDWFMTNVEVLRARHQINTLAGTRRLHAHAVFTPGRAGWLDAIDQMAVLKPDGWKGYPVGSPFDTSRWPWRMDDEKLLYPAYERMVKSGITTVSIHKGLLPSGYKLLMRGNWQYAKTDDIAKAAKDWPQLTFVIHNSAILSGAPPTDMEVEDFENSGQIRWVSDLAAIPEREGVKNLYVVLGSAYALTAVGAPRFSAGIVGTLIRGFGPERVLWGTDSIWYGSPQWQIEAFRRLEIPEDLQERFGYAPLGAPDGPVKREILGENAARLYLLETDPARYAGDGIGARRAARSAG